MAGDIAFGNSDLDIPIMISVLAHVFDTSIPVWCLRGRLKYGVSLRHHELNYAAEQIGYDQNDQKKRMSV